MADVFGGLVTSGINFGLMQQQFSNQKKLQNDAQNYNRLMWNMSNEYNTPANQMARFQSAGLNPNLIYGQMNQSASAPSSGVGSASLAQAPAMSMFEAAQIGLLKAQKENIEANTKETLAGAGLKNVQADYTQADIDRVRAVTGLTEQQVKNLIAEYDNIVETKTQIQANVDYLKSLKGKTDEETDKFHWEAQSAYIRYIHEDERCQKEIALLESQYNLNNNQAKAVMIQAYAARIAANASEQNAITNRMMAESNIKLNDAEIDKVNAARQQIDAQTEGINLDNKVKAPAAEWSVKHPKAARNLYGANQYLDVVNKGMDVAVKGSQTLKNVGDTVSDFVGLGKGKGK